MRKCSVCSKNLLDDEENVCKSCNSKIENLNHLLDNNPKKNMISSDIKQESKYIKTDYLVNDVEKGRNNRKILLVLAFLFLLMVLSMELIRINNASEIKKYESLNKNVGVSDYNISSNEDTVKNKVVEYKYSYNLDDFVNYKDNVRNKEVFKKIGDQVKLNENQLKELNKAFDGLLMDTSKVEILSSNKDISGKKIYKILYDTQKLNALFENDKLIYISNILNEKLYEDDKVNKTFDKFLLELDKMKEIINISKKIINLVNVEPTVSRYPNLENELKNWNIFMENDVINVNSFVKYNNGGQIIRNDFKILLVKKGDRYYILDLIYNGEKSKKLIY